MKYNWSKYNLIDRLEKLEKLLDGNITKQERHDISFNIRLLSNYLETFNNEQYEDYKFLEDLKIDNIYYQQHKFIMDDISLFSYNDINCNNIDSNLNIISINKKELLEITHDFYKSLDKEIYNTFMKQFNVRHDHLKFINCKTSEEDNLTFGIPYLKEAFIQIYKSDNIEVLFSLIHEYAHATSFTFNSNHLCDRYKSFLCETDSIFSELIASDYIKENCNIGSEYLDMAFQRDGFIYSAKLLNDKTKLLDLYNNDNILSNKQLKTTAQEKLNFTSEYVEDLISMDMLYETPYVISYLFAVELYQLYKLDKEKSLHILKKFTKLNNVNRISYYKELKKSGLYPNHNFDLFDEDLEDKLLLQKK